MEQCPKEAYIEGFLTGQLIAYCEQVKLGSRLAGSINCDSRYLEKLLAVADQQECRTRVMEIELGRVCLWVYKYEFLERIIPNLEGEHTPTDFGIWATGKIFGYGDSEIARYIEENSAERIR